MLVVVAVAIVALSGAAGWTSGQREANTNATATQNAAIDEQMAHIPGDIGSSNLAAARRAPALAGDPDARRPRRERLDGDGDGALPELAADGDAAAASPTPEASSAKRGDRGARRSPPEASGGYDLAGILSQAQSADRVEPVAGRDRPARRDPRRDPSFRDGDRPPPDVRSRSTATPASFTTPSSPPKPTVIVDRARALRHAGGRPGTTRAMAAELYLTARTAAGTGSPVAISALQAADQSGAGALLSGSADAALQCLRHARRCLRRAGRQLLGGVAVSERDERLFERGRQRQIRGSAECLRSTPRRRPIQILSFRPTGRSRRLGWSQRRDPKQRETRVLIRRSCRFNSHFRRRTYALVN